MNDREIEELLGAYALDAVDDDERRHVEEFLVDNPRAREEVALHREVATRLAFTGADAPAGLWDRIAKSLQEPAPVVPLMRSRLASPAAARRRRRLLGGGLAAAAAALVAIVVLSVRVANLDDHVGQSATAASSIEQGALAALRDPTAKITSLVSSDGRLDVTAVLETDGIGFLVPHRLRPASPGHTYQLWGVTGDTAISLGVLGRAPTVVPFHAQGQPHALAITEELGNGVIASKNAPLVVGTFT